MNLGWTSKKKAMDLPGDPVIKTLQFQYRGIGANPGWGLRSHMMWQINT